MLLKLDEGRVINTNHIVRIWANETGNYDIVLINNETIKITRQQFERYQYIIEIRTLEDTRSGYDL